MGHTPSGHAAPLFTPYAPHVLADGDYGNARDQRPDGDDGKYGGNTITHLIGDGFGGTAPQVTVGGVPANRVRVVSPTELEVTTPAHAAGTVDVVLTVGGQSVTKVGAFTHS